MYNGDRSRKGVLVEYGFRLPSAMDNRPLTLKNRAPHGEYRLHLRHARPIRTEARQQVVEQIIRPTGLVDPQVEVRPVEGQVDDLVAEIRKRVELDSVCW